jgi:RHS repeat-associated protein
VTNFLSGQPYTAGKPKAYINWVLLDEQFQYVTGSSGSEQVGASDVFTIHVRNNLPVHVNGYLYVYASNETNNIDVFFDNLSVTHIKGPLVEETHYDPLGLEMVGISSTAYKSKYISNRFKYQGQEFESSFKFNMLEFDARQYDPQIGRWIVTDPSDQFSSPYLAMGNNWPVYMDPDGRFAFLPILIGAVVGGTINGIKADYHGKPFFQAAWKGAVLGAAGAGIGSGLTGIGAFAAWGYVGGGAAIGGITGAATGGLGAALNDQNVLHGALSGGLQGLITGAAFGAIRRALMPNKPSYIETPDDVTSNADAFTSQDELEDFITDNIEDFGTVTHTFKTNINLATSENLPKGYGLEDDIIVTRAGVRVAGLTTPTGGGWFTKAESQILMSPGIKGYLSNGISYTKMPIIHELIHAYHMGFLTNFNSVHSEHAAYAHSYAYMKSIGASKHLLDFYRNSVGSYPKQYGWRNIYTILKTGSFTP